LTKTCTRCHLEKELSLFAIGSKYRNGRRNYCKSCHANYVTEFIRVNPSKRTKHNPDRRFKRHGLTEVEYQKLYNQYDGKCHSCKIREEKNIDHDHNCCPGSYSCGRCIRGLLCSQCNTALGLLSDDIHKIKSLIDYIT